jgi:hypothetical protein
MFTVSLVNSFNQDRGAFPGTAIFERYQNARDLLPVSGTFSRASHLGTTVRIQLSPLRRI